MTGASAPVGSRHEKPWYSLQARATLRGYVAELVELDDGRTALIVTSGSVTRPLRSIAEAEAWLLDSEADH